MHIKKPRRGRRRVEIDGYGPVTIRALTPKQCATVVSLGGDSLHVEAVHTIMRGLVKPSPHKRGFIEEFRQRPDALIAIAAAIADFSYEKATT